ncbi:N-acetylmannosamine-6-phosphate 2-epimerase [Tunturibacter empetritectus]|uniref:N-acylglucosamine-6-phosphate 2-epimerase n=1 Tax=Tunturiibacter empetritectus TaxID=3069691 RepID=A0A7W8MRP6_9BACT|nr:N-acetylmannosamine-6-phosphate 2-epimerase [Edaphobacter lichenicola]MBB5317035.1 N-acylglucosamine-6-phosphate 2-epimerase [Edaphobacter lichenicola]
MPKGSNSSFNSLFHLLRGRIIVSCQAAEGDPLDDLDTLTRIATSVLRGGAGGLRAEGTTRIAAFRALTQLPIIGIIKTCDANGDVYITPDFRSAKAVVDAGADIVALDCTARRLTAPEPWTELIPRTHTELRRPVLADIASLEDALAAERAGADAVATTLYGYTTETAGIRSPSWPLLQSLLAHLTVPVLLEGHITHPTEALQALDMGATAVVIGSAITRPETITNRFVQVTRQTDIQPSSK